MIGTEKETTIQTLKDTITAGQAESIVSAKSSSHVARTQKLVYYPYYWIHYKFSFAIHRYKRVYEAHVFVDMLSNQGSTSDRFEHYPKVVPAHAVLEPNISEEDAVKTAKVYFFHSVVNKMKMLFIPREDIQAEGVLHKPFWIVKCKHRQKDPFHVIVDGLTGKYQVLPKKM